MSYLPFSRRWAGRLAAGAGLPPEKEAVLAYAIEVLALNLLNVLFALALGLALGVLPGTAACLAAAALFRHTAGGAHSSSPWRCGALTVAAFPAIALLAKHLSALGRPFIDVFSALAVLAGAAAVVLLAPVDSPAAPVVSPARRKRLKLLALAALAAVAAALFALGRCRWAGAGEVRLCLGLTVLWAGFMLTKHGHRLVALIDGLKIKKRRR